MLTPDQNAGDKTTVMTNQALPLSTKDYAAAATALARAFEDDPAILAILKGYSAQERIQALNIAFGANLQQCGPQAAPLSVYSEAELAGAALIHRPGTYPPPLAAQLKVFWAGFKALRSPTVLWRWAKLLSTMDKHHPKEPHFYLEILGVDPQWQGIGFGSRLMERLNKWADAEGVGSYLETAKAGNVPFYERHGFQVVKELDIIGVHIWLMWRSPTR